MPSTDHLLAFLLATLIFAVIPGPGILYTAAQTLARGRLGGLMAALGIHLGGYLHVAAAALGLAALFELVPLIYTIVKLAGALYLVILGIGILRGGIAADALPAVAGKSPRRAFLGALLSCLPAAIRRPGGRPGSAAAIPRFRHHRQPRLLGGRSRRRAAHRFGAVTAASHAHRAAHRPPHRRQHHDRARAASGDGARVSTGRSSLPEIHR